MEVLIEIRDKSVPIIELFEETLILDYKSNLQEGLEGNIKRAYLGADDITNLVQIKCDQLKQEIGVYQITYLYDLNGKYAEKECQVHVLSTTKPIILIQNIQTEIGNKVNLKDYIQVEDASDQTVSNHIELDENAVDYTKAGVYPVSVCVTNSSNLTAYETLYVTVLEKKQQSNGFSLVTWIPVILILGGFIIAGGIFFLIWRKKKLHS